MPFTQLDFAGSLGLAEGRYLARAEQEGEADRVLIVQLLGAPHPGSRMRRRTRSVVPPAEPETVPVTRLTVARATRFEDEDEAAGWLRATAGDRASRVAEARDAVALVNRALEALREATEDPLVQDVGASRALAIRIGYGSGEQIAAGRWSEAEQLPPPPTPRRENLDPQERVARALSGRGEEE